MNLENTFYTLGIMYMIAGIIILIILAIMVFYIFRKVTQIADFADREMKKVKEITEHPAETAYELGSKVTQLALKKVENRNKKKKISSQP